MYTGDPYRHMEVTMHSGSCKGVVGQVVASHERDGKTFLTVDAYTLQPARYTWDCTHVKERL